MHLKTNGEWKWSKFWHQKVYWLLWLKLILMLLSSKVDWYFSCCVSRAGVPSSLDPSPASLLFECVLEGLFQTFPNTPALQCLSCREVSKPRLFEGQPHQCWGRSEQCWLNRHLHIWQKPLGSISSQEHHKQGRQTDGRAVCAAVCTAGCSGRTCSSTSQPDQERVALIQQKVMTSLSSGPTLADTDASRKLWWKKADSQVPGCRAALAPMPVGLQQ